MLRHHNRLVVPLLITVLALFAAACGDANDATAETAADAGDTATTQPDDGASVEADCSTKAESDALFNEADPFDPVSLEAAFLANVGLMDAALQNIPAEIEDDLRVVRQSMDDYIDVLEANDWDFFAASSAIEEIEGPELEAAEARLETWEVANCGFPEDGDDFEDALDEDPFSAPEAFEAMLSSDVGRAMIIEGMTEDGELTADQAECMLDNLDFVALAGISSGDEPDPEIFSALFNVAVTCDLGEEFLADCASNGRLRCNSGRSVLTSCARSLRTPYGI